jgi:hypothetical protein
MLAMCGGIDELQDLLRKCDYQPGDLVRFFGADLLGLLKLLSSLLV